MITLHSLVFAQENAAVPRSDNPFWKFSLAVYAQAGVAEECLRLQDALNIDVNVLLFCAWVGAEKQLVLNDKNVAAIDDAVRGWHRSVVRPLRTARRAMKPMPEMEDDAVQALRKEIAAAELKAEQIEQALLFDNMPALIACAAVAGDPRDAVRANIAAFVRRNATGAAETPATPSLIAAAIGYRSAAANENP
jgi:uncharacterized protein (TIGR02444 family)